MSETRPRTFSRTALARLAVTTEAADASDRYRALAADGDHSPYGQPGELVDYAWRLAEQARAILQAAVVTERLAGTSWETIGENLGEISKQAAHERYGAAETVFRRAALMAWLVPGRADDQLGELADADAALARLTRWLQAPHQPPAAGADPGTRPASAVSEPLPPGYPEMSDTERAGLIIEAANLLTGVGTYKRAGVTEHERRDVELGLARRKVELYEAIAADRPDDTEHADLLAGARARLATLEGDELAARRSTRKDQS
ncbi:hypothetical protein [Nonomuraea sp. LPB2021202275-12-8]|uniref:hypothetical protein n=1 Tax=Nonomuraea sp. LPB2021202275-12-8 TaxID=3120159 RepID=UPI00300D6EC0